MRIEELEDLKVTLRVNDTDLNEYGDESDEAHSTTPARTFVEAEAGASFAIVANFGLGFRYNNGRDSIVCHVYMDGKYATGRVWAPSHGHADVTHDVNGVLSCTRGVWSLQRFTFSDLQTDDTAGKVDFKERFKHLGTIRATFTRCTETGKGTYDGGHDFSAAGEQGVHEKCLKGRAISKQATLGKAEVSACTGWVSTQYPYGKDPFASFTFKYRSKTDLQIEGIIPRSPSPVPLEDRNPDDLSAEEARELVRRHRAREAAVKTEVKKEKRAHSQVIDDDDEDDDVTIASENRSRKRHRASRDSGVEIIDLSED
ncbi:hypothetical protein LTR36_001925 [Oleoguttula mirabilis]|uniref:DUF7918 domain-containing protein n=1 Tax=Oleoguttula mirabilis TaxID=1507867 RepID=A0AAV9JNM9_9PEZI|nr:hypothetical protein LTR36_001925 [Oleoguttula mirabilis]